MALRISGEIIRLNINNAANIDVSCGEMARGDEVPKPLGGERIELVKVVLHNGSRTKRAPTTLRWPGLGDRVRSDACTASGLA